MTAPTPQLHAESYEELIERRGREVQWEEASLCSCWNIDSGQPQYSCKACGGKGFKYEAPVIRRALVTSVTLNKDYQDMAGVFEVGDAVMTVPKRIPSRINGQPKSFTDNPMFDIGQNDRITLLDDEYKTSEVLAKNLSVGRRDPDTLLNEVITRVKNVRAYDSTTGEYIDYEEGVDFSINGNKVEWLEGGNSPEDFQQYSITYFHKPSYVVTATLPKPRHQDGQDLPRYVALRYMSGAVDRQ